MSVHAQVPARAHLSPQVKGGARLGAVSSQLWWLLGGLVLAFGVPFLLADLAGLQT